MEKQRGIIIIGAGNVGKECAIKLAQTNNNNICDLHSVVDSQFTDLKEVFEITRTLIDIPTTYVDEKFVKGLRKHKETCLKNRKARKKRKRR